MTVTRPDMKIVREEIFGPVVVAEPFRGLDEIAAEANNTSYGLGADIWRRVVLLLLDRAAAQYGMTWQMPLARSLGERHLRARPGINACQRTTLQAAARPSPQHAAEPSTRRPSRGD